MAQFFKEEDIEEFRECFYLNNSGHIMNEKSLRFTMRSLGFSPTVEESMKYWMKNRKDDGVDFATFLNILHDHSQAEDCEREIIAAFAAQDSKKSGLVSAKEFIGIMTQFGEKVDRRIVDAVLRESGQTGPQIRYSDVVRTLLNPPPDY